MRHLITLSLLLAFVGTTSAQLTLLLERADRVNAERLYRGDELRYQILGDDLFRNGQIQEFRPDLNSIIVDDRYVSLDEVAALDLGRNGLVYASGLSLQTFGAGWAFFGLVGYAVDGNPDTRFGRGDLIVSTTSFAAGFLLAKLSRRKFKIGPNRRLRIVDLTF